MVEGKLELMSRFYDKDFNPLFPDDIDSISDMIRQDRDAQDAKFDRIVRESSHRREIMMAQKIIDENTLCLAGVEPCESCQKELDNQ
jgi:hypothetical protein